MTDPMALRSLHENAHHRLLRPRGKNACEGACLSQARRIRPTYRLIYHLLTYGGPTYLPFAVWLPTYVWSIYPSARLPMNWEYRLGNRRAHNYIQLQSPNHAPSQLLNVPMGARMFLY